MSKADFDPTKIKKVKITEVEPNKYNPKLKDTKEFENVVRSIQLNGLKQPIFVREEKGNDKLVIVDGEQRYTAAAQLGYKEIYVYNLGEITEEEAKSLTIWFEVSVPFYELDLAPLAVELNSIGMELPFTENELTDFKNMSEFDFDEAYKDDEPVEDESGEKLKTLNVKMTADQLMVVKDAIKLVSENENVSEGRALELLVADGLAGYQQTNYIPENEEEA